MPGLYFVARLRGLSGGERGGKPISEIAFKRLLTPMRGDDATFFRGDWTLNLYRGCNHGCVYCDTRSLCYRITDFSQVRVKMDCLAALEKELRGKKAAGVVSMGAASDAYNAREAALAVTRGALRLLRRYGFGVFISTKSELIARDADVLGDLASHGYACVAFSVTTPDAAVAAWLEPNAPEPSRRFAAMRTLAAAGVVTGLWLNPMLPFLTDTPETVRTALRQTAEAGGRFALCHFGVTLREGDREFFYQALDAQAGMAGMKSRYMAAFGLRYLCPSPDAQRLSGLFVSECDRLGLLHDFASVNRLAAAATPTQLKLW